MLGLRMAGSGPLLRRLVLLEREMDTMILSNTQSYPMLRQMRWEVMVS